MQAHEFFTEVLELDIERFRKSLRVGPVRLHDTESDMRFDVTAVRIQNGELLIDFSSINPVRNDQ